MIPHNTHHIERVCNMTIYTKWWQLPISEQITLFFPHTLYHVCVNVMNLLQCLALNKCREPVFLPIHRYPHMPLCMCVGKCMHVDILSIHMYVYPFAFWMYLISNISNIWKRDLKKDLLQCLALNKCREPVLLAIHRHPYMPDALNGLLQLLTHRGTEKRVR
jgi:hypothetical protein